MQKLLATDGSWASLIVRLGLGVAMFPHGMQKLLGWFGGAGFAGTLQFLTGGMHVPVWLAVLVIVVESFGSIGLILGCLTRLAAFGIVCDMIGAVYLVHWQNGFFMNWSGRQAGEGFEYHILMLAMGLALIVAGGGKWSIDGLLASRRRGYRR